MNSLVPQQEKKTAPDCRALGLIRDLDSKQDKLCVLHKDALTMQAL